MNNVTFIDITEPFTNAVTTYAIIDRGNGEFTSMPKFDYDALQTVPAVVHDIPPVAPSAEPSDTITPAQPDEVAPSEGTTNVS